jgi:phosphinothricin acetyltransferase
MTMIRPAITADAEAIATIYNHYVVNTCVTFEEEAVSATDMAQRIGEIISAGLPWLVWEEAGKVFGYTYASRWKARCAYRYAVEATIYLDKDATGRRVGTQLYAALIDELRRQKFHSIIGGVALPNAASVALQEKFGFKQVAQFREVGWKFQQWIDVGYWELLL